MRKISSLLAVISMASLVSPVAVWAQLTSVTATTKTPPTVVPTDGNLGGIPANIKTLITSFALTRDQFLAKQNVLLARLSKATTAAERQQIRDGLQQNRQSFLTALQTFREQLKDQLTALKGKITHKEFQRIIEEASPTTTEGGLDHHRGH